MNRNLFRTATMAFFCIVILCSCSKEGENGNGGGNGKPTSYTVTFDSGGGTSVQSQTVERGEKATSPSNPTRSGYTFVFWHLKGATTAYDFNTPVNSNITLVAKWDQRLEATLRITVNPGAGWYTSLRVSRISGEGPAFYNIPTNSGTHTITVSPGTYRISYTYMSCTHYTCLSSGWSSNFTVSAGQARNISVVGTAVGW
jgi:uncharacterized repeat protein (TIGR02543 family)